MPWGGVRQQTELCTSNLLYFDSVLEGGASWPPLLPRHAGSSRGRSYRGVALPLLCQHFHQLRVMYMYLHEGEVGWGD